MANKWGLIFIQGAGTDPARDRVLVDGNGLTTTIVAVPNPQTALRVATELVDDGAEFIELSGGFSPYWTAKVIEAVNGRVPVGAVAYSADALVGLASIARAVA